MSKLLDFAERVSIVGSVYNLGDEPLTMEDVDRVFKVAKKTLKSHEDEYILYGPKVFIREVLLTLMSPGYVGTFNNAQTMMFCEGSFNRGGINVHLIADDTLSAAVLTPAHGENKASKSFLIQLHE